MAAEAQASAGALGWLEPLLRRCARPIVRACARAGLSPNALTLATVAGNAVAAIVLGSGQHAAGGILVLAVNALDLLDGELARATGQTSRFGAFLDSVCDRYSDLLIFAGLLAWYGRTGDPLLQMAVFACAAGSMLVSYTRARAEGLGLGAETGAFQRLERVVFLGLGLLLPWPAIAWVVVLLAAASNVTAVQRILHVRRLLGTDQRR
jgi:CDP-diacylglycerol--glycerol-3-phosphate 3-phosphatidyltransferase